MAEDDRSTSILVTTWTLTGLSGVFLSARVVCKLKTKRYLWWDDHILILSWLMLLVSIILVTQEVSRGLGKHIHDVNPANIETMHFIGNFTGTFSILAAVWSKTSFAVTLLRLMSARMKVVLWAIIVSINIFMGLNAIFMWVRCNPVSLVWTANSATENCWEPRVYPAYAMFAAGYSGLMDFVLALLPWQVIWKLQMKRNEKLGVALAMSMGIFAGATAIVKTVVIPTIASPDFTYVSASLITWGSAESAVTVMAASIPVLRPLFRDIQALTRRYYGGSRRGTEIITRYANPMELSFGPSPVVRATTGGSDSTPLQPCGKILQRNEFSVTVEYCGGKRGDSIDEIQGV